MSEKIADGWSAENHGEPSSWRRLGEGCGSFVRRCPQCCSVLGSAGSRMSARSRLLGRSTSRLSIAGQPKRGLDGRSGPGSSQMAAREERSGRVWSQGHSCRAESTSRGEDSFGATPHSYPRTPRRSRRPTTHASAATSAWVVSAAPGEQSGKRSDDRPPRTSRTGQLRHRRRFGHQGAARTSMF